jgi:anti-anti-sigma factor
LDAANVEQYRKAIESDVSISKNFILDFSHVKFIDSSGLGFLLSLWRQSENEKKNLFMTGLSSPIKRFLELNRSYELFKGRIYSRMDEVLNFIADKLQIPPFYYFEVVRNRTVTVYLFGTLDAGQMANLNFESIQNSIGNKDCIINLMDLTFVDSSGIVFFLKIQKHTSGNGKACLICELQDNVLQMFRITKLHRLFTICDSLASAEKVLKQTRSITTR